MFYVVPWQDPRLATVRLRFTLSSHGPCGATEKCHQQFYLAGLTGFRFTVWKIRPTTSDSESLGPLSGSVLCPLSSRQLSENLL